MFIQCYWLWPWITIHLMLYFLLISHGILVWQYAFNIDATRCYIIDMYLIITPLLCMAVWDVGLQFDKTCRAIWTLACSHIMSTPRPDAPNHPLIRPMSLSLYCVYRLVTVMKLVCRWILLFALVQVLSVLRPLVIVYSDVPHVARVSYAHVLLTGGHAHFVFTVTIRSVFKPWPISMDAAFGIVMTIDGWISI